MKYFDEIYGNLKPVSTANKDWNNLLNTLKRVVEVNVKDIRVHYSNDRACSYISKPNNLFLDSTYVIFRQYLGSVIEKKIARIERACELRKKVDARMQCYLLFESNALLMDKNRQQAAFLRPLPVGDLEELLECTRIHVPIQLLKFYFRKLAQMLEKVHLAGFCHWGLYNNRVKLSEKMLPEVRFKDNLHQINSLLPGGLRCRYQLPPLYTADMKVEQITPANKKAIDLYMLGVVIYRALLGVPFPYARVNGSKGIQRYNFTPLAISFPSERLEVMGWTLEEVKGSKSLLEGLLHLDPARQMTT
jgi:hypothetical protein